jgi:hypothetical protein
MRLDNSISNPAAWHRRLCEVTDWLFLSGDLDTFRPEIGIRQLNEWVNAGITDIIDVRGEYDDIDFVKMHAPHINYHYFGTHDNGGSQSDSWFELGVNVISDVVERDGKAVVHCHMGVNRAPSMAYRLLLEAGHGHIESLEMIRSSRPIAGIIYAPSALSHYLRINDVSATELLIKLQEVEQWFDENPVDLGWIISRIRRSE